MPHNFYPLTKRHHLKHSSRYIGYTNGLLPYMATEEFKLRKVRLRAKANSDKLWSTLNAKKRNIWLHIILRSFGLNVRWSLIDLVVGKQLPNGDYVILVKPKGEYVKKEKQKEQEKVIS